VAETDARSGRLSRTMLVDIVADAVRRRRDQISFLRQGDGDETVIKAFDEMVGLDPVSTFSGRDAMARSRAWLDRRLVEAGMNAVEILLKAAISTQDLSDPARPRPGLAAIVFPDDPEAVIHDAERPLR